MNEDIIPQHPNFEFDNDNDNDSDSDPEMIELIGDFNDSDDDDDFYFFSKIINLFKNDEEINYLTNDEYSKLLVRLLSINVNIVSQPIYDSLKNDILRNRAFKHESVRGDRIFNLLRKKNIDCRYIHNTLNENVYKNSCTETDLEVELNGDIFNHNNNYALNIWTYSNLDENLKQTFIPDLSEEELNKVSRTSIKQTMDHFDFIYKNQYNISNINSNNSNNSNNIINSSKILLSEFPNEILENILIYSLPSINLDLRKFFNTRLVCKKFHKIMINKHFLDKVLETYKLCDVFYERYKYTEQLGFLLLNNLAYEYINLVFKKYIISLIGEQLIKALGGFKAYFDLPFIELDWKCLDNLCIDQCSTFYHLLNKNINSPIIRGCDTIGRQFVLFIYKSIEDSYYYEFIFNNEIPNDFNITYTGVNLKTFIGNNSVNYNVTNEVMYRTLKNKSYIYIEKLIKGEAYEMEYDNSLSYITENKDRIVTLDYNRDKIIKYLNIPETLKL